MDNTEEDLKARNLDIGGCSGGDWGQRELKTDRTASSSADPTDEKQEDYRDGKQRLAAAKPAACHNHRIVDHRGQIWHARMDA